ncbi:MAG TPA: hypothetical protein VFL77_05385 [Solirubrobacterales bacterium]|nr:hypothetical protein [Solirubrobacterales bacterium]
MFKLAEPSSPDLSDEAKQLIAALLSPVEIERIFATDEVWEEAQAAFPVDLMPDPDADTGTIRIGEAEVD